VTQPVSVVLPPVPATNRPEAAGRLAAEAEALGFAGIWVSDHVLFPVTGGPDDTTHQLDPVPFMSWLAARTSTLRLGTSVLVLPYRDPIVAAKALATVDWLAGGRLVLGVGAGWLREEFDALGVPFSERGARTDEAIRVLRSLWAGERSFEGRWTRFDGMVSEPGARIPILVGGNSKAAIERAARLGDGWFPLPVPPDAAAAEIDRYREACRRAERPVGRVVLHYRPPGDTASGEEVAAFAAAGADEVVLSTQATELDGVLESWRAYARVLT
jgi:probable F420-dependent oxidoreductase